MAVLTGLNCYAYYMSAGSFASPTWTLYTAVVDVTINRERTEIAASSRGSTFEKFLVGLKKLGVDINALRDNADTTQIALETAYEAGSVIVMGFADGPIATSGTKYVKIECVVTKLMAGEPLEGVATIDITIKPAAGGTNNPTYGTTGS